MFEGLLWNKLMNHDDDNLRLVGGLASGKGVLM
jgi:hypothetical protein